MGAANSHNTDKKHPSKPTVNQALTDEQYEAQIKNLQASTDLLLTHLRGKKREYAELEKNKMCSIADNLISRLPKEDILSLPPVPLSPSTELPSETSDAGKNNSPAWDMSDWRRRARSNAHASYDHYRPTSTWSSGPLRNTEHHHHRHHPYSSVSKKMPW